MTEQHSRMIALAGGRQAGIAEYGDPAGMPVLALHGAPACRIMFELAGEPAKRLGLRILAPDRPGYGLTPADGYPTLAARCEWLEQVCDALGLERFAILAISGGAPYAVALAARLGRRIRALALGAPMGPVADFVASDAGARSEIPFLQRRFFLHLPRRAIFPPLARVAGRVYMLMPRGTGALFPVLSRDPDAKTLRRPDVRETMLRMTQEAVRRGADGGIADLKIYGQPWGVDYSAITAPSLLWQGDCDRIVPIAASRYLAAQIPGCRLRTVPGAGHFWIFRHLDEFLDGMTAIAS